MDLEELKAVSTQLNNFVDFFKQELGRSERRHWCQMYLCGLMLNGERKSIQPMAQRLPGGNEQALQQFVNQSPWDFSIVQAKLAKYLVKEMNTTKGVLILDDTCLPKQGDKSVGVAHQYCVALGKIANCQSILTWHYSGMEGDHFPVTAELYLPKKWTSDRKRLKAGKVPQRRHKFQKKWQLALEHLKTISKEEFPYEAIVFDAGYGEIREFLGELDKQGLIFVAQIPENHSFWPLDVKTKFTQTKKGRPRLYPTVEDKKSKPISAKKWKDQCVEKGMRWQKIPLSLKSKKETKVFVMRVKEAIAQAFYRPGAERWLIIEKLGNNEYKYYASNAPQEMSIKTMVAWAHKRWKIEQGYQQLKEELGMDHFEGRSWGGLHRHITLCFMAYAFLILLRRKAGEKNKTNATINQKDAKLSVRNSGVSTMQTTSSPQEPIIF